MVNAELYANTRPKLIRANTPKHARPTMAQCTLILSQILTPVPTLTASQVTMGELEAATILSPPLPPKPKSSSSPSTNTNYAQKRKLDEATAATAEQKVRILNCD